MPIRTKKQIFDCWDKIFHGNKAKHVKWKCALNVWAMTNSQDTIYVDFFYETMIWWLIKVMVKTHNQERNVKIVAFEIVS